VHFSVFCHWEEKFPARWTPLAEDTLSGNEGDERFSKCLRLLSKRDAFAGRHTPISTLGLGILGCFCLKKISLWREGTVMRSFLTMGCFFEYSTSTRQRFLLMESKRGRVGGQPSRSTIQTSRWQIGRLPSRRLLAPEFLGATQQGSACHRTDNSQWPRRRRNERRF
jgi:hypothetical protein